MSVDEAIRAYNELAKKVFSDRRILNRDGKYDEGKLKAAILKIVNSQSRGDYMIEDDSKACKT